MLERLGAQQGFEAQVDCLDLPQHGRELVVDHALHLHSIRSTVMRAMDV